MNLIKKETATTTTKTTIVRLLIEIKLLCHCKNIHTQNVKEAGKKESMIQSDQLRTCKMCKLNVYLCTP